jgi:hypothetical protein
MLRVDHHAYTSWHTSLVFCGVHQINQHQPSPLLLLALPLLVTPMLALQVARRVAFSEQQLPQLRRALQIYGRMARESAAEGSGLLQSVASLSISRVLEGLNNSSSSSGAATGSGGTNISGSSSSGANVSGSGSDRHTSNAGPPADVGLAAEEAAAAAAGGDAGDACLSPAASPDTAAAEEDGPAAEAANPNDGAAQIELIDSQMQRLMRLRIVHACAANFMMMNHISKLQMAQTLVGEDIPRLGLQS